MAARMELFFEIHRDLPREGPGHDAATARALAMVPNLPERPRILDVGCGPGAQTLVLARRTGGHVTAVDTHPPYLDELTRRAEQAGLSHQITPRNVSMFALDFEDGSFDLIWSEGAVYVMGFREGLRAWRRLLKPGGGLAVSELAWLVEDPSEAPRRFFEAAYPAMQHADANVAVIREEGYRPVGRFTLPEAAWWDDYYTPLEQRLAALRTTYRDDPTALALLDDEQREIDLFRKYASTYGYVFYVMGREDVKREDVKREDVEREGASWKRC